MGGAIARVPADATAFLHRDARWLINIPGMWEAPRQTAAEVAWVRATFAALKPHLTGGTYVNFIGDDDDAGTGDAYGTTLARLRRVKREFDPDNVFRLNQNVRPA